MKEHFREACKPANMALLMKEVFDTEEQQWYYCHPTISFWEQVLYISPKNAFRRLGTGSFVRVRRSHFSTRTSVLSEEHVAGVTKMAAGSLRCPHQFFLSPTSAFFRGPTLHLCFLQISLAPQAPKWCLVVTQQERLNIYQRTREQIPQASKPQLIGKSSI